jgi:hypothetical protein
MTFHSRHFVVAKTKFVCSIVDPRSASLAAYFTCDRKRACFARVQRDVHNRRNQTYSNRVRIRTTPKAMKEVFGRMPRSRIAPLMELLD